jgi:hypothetical protein
VQRDNDRDRAIEHVLRQVSAAAPVDDRACVDGETIAAWTEGQLRGAEADTIERHLSTCARCQQLLAAFARTSPPPVVAMPLWRRWRLQWLVPIATAATVAAIWVATPQQDRAAYVEPPAPNQASRPSESAPARQDGLSQSAAAKPDAVQESDAASSRRNRAANPLARKAASAPAAPSALEKREEFEKRLDDQKAIVDLQTPPATAAPAPAAAAPPPAAPVPRAEADTEKRDTGLRPQQRESTAAGAVAGGAVAETAPRAPQAAPTSANDQRERSAQVGALRGFAQTSAPREIVSPNPANRWRITGGRQVERTTNSGTRWEAVTLPSTGVLTAGTSPGPTVCWIVGRGGTVYLTTDGSRFIRIAFPEPLDLVSITATDDRHATVTAADGRTFATADRGETWAMARP